MLPALLLVVPLWASLGLAFRPVNPPALSRP
jgi:hypothetical protein